MKTDWKIINLEEMYKTMTTDKVGKFIFKTAIKEGSKTKNQPKKILTK